MNRWVLTSTDGRTHPAPTPPPSTSHSQRSARSLARSLRNNSGSTSKPRQDSSRLKRTSGPQQPASSRVRINALGVAELRKYAFEVTVKNEDLKHRLKSSNELYSKLHDAYQRLKERSKEIEVEEAMVVEKKVRRGDSNSKPKQIVEERRRGACDDRPSSSCGPSERARARRDRAPVHAANPSVRRSPRNHGHPVTGVPSAPNVTDSQQTPRSAVTASQLPEGLVAWPQNFQLAALTDECDGRDDSRNDDDANDGKDTNDDDTPRNGRHTDDEETPKDAVTVRKRLLKSPAWETIQKKKKLENHVHMGYEHIPAPEDPVKRLELPGISGMAPRPGTGAGRQLDEQRAFKYFEVVRKQDERAKLPAGFCADCARFYRVYAQNGDLQEADALVKRLCGHTIHAQTSRHRQKWYGSFDPSFLPSFRTSRGLPLSDPVPTNPDCRQAPDSPEDFWHIRPPEPHT